MKDKLRKAFFVAMLGTGAGFGASGAYLAGDAAVKEYVTQAPAFDRGKACVREVKQGRECSTADYRQAAIYADNKKDYAFGLSWLFGGASFVRMSLPRVRRKKPDGNKPAA